MTAVEDRTVVSREAAENLEREFLGGLEDAQFAYERIVETEAWKLLGFDSFADWWAQRVQPVMRALSMRPTREIAASVVERVREEEAELPPAQRRTQRELADMVGISTKTLQRQNQDRAEETLSARADLEDGEEPPLPGMPEGQNLADAIVAGIEHVLSRPVEPLPHSRERDEQTSREAASKNLAKCVWTLAEFAQQKDAAERMVAEWEPTGDIYFKPVTAQRLREAAAYLAALAERWPR